MYITITITISGSYCFYTSSRGLEHTYLQSMVIYYIDTVNRLQVSPTRIKNQVVLVYRYGVPHLRCIAYVR